MTPLAGSLSAAPAQRSAPTASAAVSRMGSRLAVRRSAARVTSVRGTVSAACAHRWNARVPAPTSRPVLLSVRTASATRRRWCPSVAPVSRMGSRLAVRRSAARVTSVRGTVSAACAHRRQHRQHRQRRHSWQPAHRATPETRRAHATAPAHAATGGRARTGAAARRRGPTAAPARTAAPVSAGGPTTITSSVRNAGRDTGADREGWHR
jgi:hypothetical protein